MRGRPVRPETTAMRRAAPTLVLIAALAGCAPTYTQHGFAPQLAELGTIEAGVDTRGSVLRKLGRPSTTGSFDADAWYYVASTMERFAFYAPKVVDRTVVAVSFDEAGMVTAVNRYGLEDGRIIDLVTRTTPTYGRELTVVQQLFGNIGAGNPGELLGGRTGTGGGVGAPGI
jgi:outer membrane protein assembly factor BamE (lipoprotein component of BamABCDE complex)